MPIYNAHNIKCAVNNMVVVLRQDKHTTKGILKPNLFDELHKKSMNYINSLKKWNKILTTVNKISHKERIKTEKKIRPFNALLYQMSIIYLLQKIIAKKPYKRIRI